MFIKGNPGGNQIYVCKKYMTVPILDTCYVILICVLILLRNGPMTDAEV